FMASPRYDEVVDLVVNEGSGAPAEPAPSPSVPADAQPGPQDQAAAPSSAAGTLLARESIVLEGTARTMADAITEAGQLLVASGAVPQEYVAAMHEREESVSTHMGNGLAIPHG